MAGFFVNLNRRERVLLISLAVLLVLVLGWRLAYLPLARSYAATAAELKSRQAELAQARIKAASLEAQKERTEAARQKYDDATARFEAELADGGMVVKLGMAAQSAGVKITDWEPQGTVNQQNYVEFPVKAEITGSYAGILSFLDALETYSIEPNLVDVRQLNLSASQNNASAGGQAQAAGAASTGPEPLDAKLVLVFYSLTSPGERLAGPEAGAWSKGRSDPFASAGMVSPYPGVVPQAQPAPSTPAMGGAASGSGWTMPPGLLQSLLPGSGSTTPVPGAPPQSPVPGGTGGTSY